MRSLLKYLGWMIVTTNCLLVFWTGVVYLLCGDNLLQRVAGICGIVNTFIVMIIACLYQDQEDEVRGVKYKPKHMARRGRK